MSARTGLVVLVAIAAVLLLIGRTATAMFVDHAWFEAMGAPSLFWEQVIDTALLQGGAWLAGSVFAFANLHAVRRTILAVAVPSRVANLELTAMVPGRRLLTATIVLSLIVGGILALPLTNWETVALMRHGLPFGEIEGIFDRDLGHYVYWLPFEETLYLWSLVSVVALTAMVLVLYALTRSLRLEGRRIAASSHVRRHLSVLGALVLALLSWSYRLDGFDLLLAGSGPDGLFLHVDHRVTLRMDYVLSYGSAIAALIILRTGWVGQLRAAFVTLTVVLVAALGLRHAAPAVLARGNTLGNPARRDADYVAARALYSRRAFDVDAIRSPADSADASGPLVPIATMPTHTSLWDNATLIDAFGQSVSGAGSVAEPATVGRDASKGSANSTGTGAMVEVSAPGWAFDRDRVRALRVQRPTVGGEAWRVTLADATLPVLRDSVVARPTAGLNLPNVWPLVAPGLVGARLLDAESAPEVAGALLDTPQSRIAHAWALRDVSLLGADSLVTTPLMVSVRDVRERVRRLAPIFEQGTTLSPVRDGTSLFWVVHLYSASDRYPFSQRWQVGDQVVTYYKLAATAIVDAASGRVRLVPVARPDAIARSWMTKLPRLFTPLSALPPSLAAQLPPATDGAELQLRTYARYGSRNDGAVVRHLPDSAFVGGGITTLVFARATGPSPGWTLPLLDDRDEVAGIATVIGGAEQSTYWTPLSKGRLAGGLAWPAMLTQLHTTADSALGFGPAPSDSVVATTSSVLPAARMSSDTMRRGKGAANVNAAPDTNGSPRPSMGRPWAVVSSRGPLVIQTARLPDTDGRLQVRAVVVHDGRSVNVGATLADALSGFGEPVERPDGGIGVVLPNTTPRSRDEPGRWYDAMRAAMKQGNWSAFGVAFDSLGRSLGRPPQ